MRNGIEVGRTSINYPRLSDNPVIFAKTSLASQTQAADQLQNPPKVSKEYDKYLNQNSLHWLLQEKIAVNRLAIAQQVHGSKVRYIDAPGVYKDIDGFYTDRSNIYLTIRTADCASVFVSVPEIPTVGIVHAGWRGARVNIAGNLIGQIMKRWDVDPQLFRVAISPHIKSCCYSVGEEFGDYFRPQYLKHRNNQLYLDFEKVIIDQLMALNIEMRNLSVSPDCTYCSNLPLYSYRAQKKTSNRLLSIISIQQ